MDKEKVIQYVMDSPENTNPAVLSSILNELISESGGSISDKDIATDEEVNDMLEDIFSN